jgi:TatD DNase family protein
MKFIDSHAHLTSEEFEGDIDAVLARANEKGIKSVINICIGLKEIERGLELSKKYPNLFLAAAVHPHDAIEENNSLFEKVAHFAKKGDLVAIGETGLDYFYKHATSEKQKEFLIDHCHLALDCNLPLIIHCREAFADFFEVVDSQYQSDSRRIPGVLHCFTGTDAEAEQVLERGWFISISGIITFKKSAELQEVVKRIPIDRLLIETDAPFLAPQNYRGKRNEPSFVPEVAIKIAELKGLTVEEVAYATTANCEKFFRLRES